MSLTNFKTLARAKQIIKDEVNKVKLNDEKVNPALVQVEYQVELSDQDFNEEKRKLRINLNKIMNLAQADEIVNDTDIITKENIYILNRSWNQFISGVTKDFSNLTFESFRTILKTFLERISEPNDQRAQLNKLADIVDILEEQAMTINGLAPTVERIKQILHKKPLDSGD